MKRGRRMLYDRHKPETADFNRSRFRHDRETVKNSLFLIFKTKLV